MHFLASKTHGAHCYCSNGNSGDSHCYRNMSNVTSPPFRAAEVSNSDGALGQHSACSHDSGLDLAAQRRCGQA